MKLSELRFGVTGRIAPGSHGPAEVQSKLYALGVFPGVPVTVLREAPFGDPLQVKVGPALLSIRRCDAEHIRVQASA